jgi:hypothetical protein
MDLLKQMQEEHAGVKTRSKKTKVDSSLCKGRAAHEKAVVVEGRGYDT